MLILKFVWIIFGAEWSLSHAAPPIALVESSVGNVSVPASKKCGVDIAVRRPFNIDFRLPIMDMEIENERNLYIIEELITHQLFMLHGNELFMLALSREQKRLSLIGLITSTANILGAEIISWRDYMILTVAMEEHLEVYQISQLIVHQRMAAGLDVQVFHNETVPLFEPIQQLTLPGKYRKHFITSPAKDQVMLMVMVNYTKINAKLRTFEWSETYFDPIEDLSIPPVLSVLSLIGAGPKYLITGRAIKHQTKSIISVFEVTAPGWKLQRRQTLTVASHVVHAVTYGGRNFLFACASINQAKCETFRMAGSGQFDVYKQRCGQEFAFSVLRAGPYFLVGARQNEVRVFANARLDCYGAISSNLSDVTAIFTHTNEHGEDHILLQYKHVFSSLLRMVELRMAESDGVLSEVAFNEDADDPSGQLEHEHLFEAVVGRLRSRLLRRQPTMDILRMASNMLAPKVSSMKLKQPVYIRAGIIGVIKVVGRKLRSPMQLLQRISHLKRSGRRFVRSLYDGTFLNAATHFNVQRLRVGNLVYDGPLLPGFHMDEGSQPQPILSVRPQITTTELHANLLEKRETYWRSQRQQMAGRVYVHRLNVLRINEVAWYELNDALFLKHRHTKVNGHLTLHADTKVISFYSQRFNDLPTEGLFNLKQSQVVNSNLLISGYFVSDLRADQVNGLNFADDIVFRNTNVVEGPVLLNRAYVGSDIFLASGVHFVRESKDSVNFQQFYNGKVTINGSLMINNLKRENFADAPPQLLVGGASLDEIDLAANYLLQNAAQTFTRPVIFGIAKVSAPNLTTKYLNDQPIVEHLLSISVPLVDSPPFLVFMFTRVAGDVNTTEINSKLRALSEEAVRHGEVANITSSKIVTAPWVVDNLLTLQLNNVSCGELISNTQVQTGHKFKGKKTFISCLVHGEAAVLSTVNATFLNNFPLAELLNYDYHFEDLALPFTLQASNVVIERINDKPFAEIFDAFRMKRNELRLHKNLIIDGSARFTEPLTLERINKLEWNAYVQSLVRSNDNYMLLEGQKRFLVELSVTRQLQVALLNNSNLTGVFERLLLKSVAQSISGAYTFGAVWLSNVDVNVMNTVPTNAFLDTRNEQIVIEGDLCLPHLTIGGDILGNWASLLDLHAAAEYTTQLPRRQWRSLMVLGNASWIQIEQQTMTGWQRQLEYLQRNAVLRASNQTIRGNVRLRRPVIGNMRTPPSFSITNELINIAKDALLKENGGQLIKGMKRFYKPMRMQIYFTAETLLVMSLLNGVDVLRLNTSLQRQSSDTPVAGPLNFLTTLDVRALQTAGSVNGVNVKKIYQVTSSAALPAVMVHDVVVDGALRLGLINGIYSLDELLALRVRKVGGTVQKLYGTLTLERMMLERSALLQSINNIPIGNIVFKQSAQLQVIIAAKRILDGVVLAGPAHVVQLNGEQLIDVYRRSVLTTGNYQLNHLLVDTATFDGGLLLSPSDALPSAWTEERASDQLTTIAEHSLDGYNTALYLDYERDVDVTWRQASYSSVEENAVDSKSFLYEVERASRCQRRMLNAQWKPQAKRLYLSKFTSNLLIMSAHGVIIRAENYCQPKRGGKMRSKIKISSDKLSKVFGMKKSIESLHILAAAAMRSLYVLLHAAVGVDGVDALHEVRILKIDSASNTITDWQSIIAGKTVQLLQSHGCNETFLAITGWSVAQRSVLNLYAFIGLEQRFKLMQTLEGEYDLLELVSLQSGKQQLLLTSQRSQHIAVYEREAGTAGNILFLSVQIMQLTAPANKLISFALHDDRFLLVLSEHVPDYYQVYNYTPSDGWVHSVCGYFHNVHLAVPFRSPGPTNNDKLLMLLCDSTQGQCGLVAARQRQ